MGTIRKDLTGSIFGRLTVLGVGGTILRGSRKEKVRQWRCLCSCGNECLVARGQIVGGVTKSCGCLAIENKRLINLGKYKDYTGRRFHNLTAIRRGESIWLKHGKRMELVSRWWFRCECGNERLCVISRVRSGAIKNCGKHRGWSKHPLYSTWYGIKTRTTNGNQISYENYGGRGIVMCKKWRDSFIVFRTDVENEIGPKPPDRTFDRINNNGNYEPGNVRWATAKEQSDNQRPRKIITKFSDEEIRQEAIRRGLFVLPESAVFNLQVRS
jgi:hypothetical protein